MKLPEFQAKWRQQAPGVNERQTARRFFNDLRGDFGSPAPNDDPSGDYVFEKHVYAGFSFVLSGESGVFIPNW